MVVRGCSRLGWAAAGAVALALASTGCGSDARAPGFTAIDEGGGGTGATVATGVTAGSTVAATGAGGGREPLGPPYPIVLAHGFFGFDDFAGLAFADYFYGVEAYLAEQGETFVFTPAVDPFNDSAVRGAQLADRVAAILASTGHEKVNLIGHSQGGLDARAVAHDHPEMVASVITLATPHGGTPVADIALRLVDYPALADVLDALVKIVGAPLYDEIGDTTSLAASLSALSEEGIAAFNAAYPDQPGVYYASVAGRSDRHGGGSDCTPDAPSFLQGYAGLVDPIDPLLAVTEALLDGGFGAGAANDGLVRVRDARWGDFLGCVPADHLDEIGHLFGDDPGSGNTWSHRVFYRELVRHLRQRGL